MPNGHLGPDLTDAPHTQAPCHDNEEGTGGRAYPRGDGENEEGTGGRAYPRGDGEKSGPTAPPPTLIR